MTSIKRKLTLTSDPGHGWLSVSLKDLVTLGIADEISHYSYMNSTRAFLEEDCDAAIFLNAAKAAAWEIEVKHSYVERTSIRSLGSYVAYFVHNPISVGSKVYVPGLGCHVTITEERKNKWILADMYRIPKSNPFNRIAPCQEA